LSISFDLFGAGTRRTPLMSPRKVIGRVVVVAVLALSPALASCSSSPGATHAQLAKASRAAAAAQARRDALKQQAQREAHLKAQIARLKKQQKHRSSGPRATATGPAAGSSLPAQSATDCGNNVSVGPNTTCAFAYNVAADYYSTAGGTQTLLVHSPVTGLDYAMTCTPGVPTICRGGNNAVVYLR
jgi:cell division protein FtsB